MFGGSFLAHLEARTLEAQYNPHPMAVLFNKSTALLLSPLHQNHAWNHPLRDSIETWTKNHCIYYCAGARMVARFVPMCPRHRSIYHAYRATRKRK